MRNLRSAVNLCVLVLGIVGAGLWVAHRRAIADNPQAAGEKPNIIVIVADDLGYGEIVVGGKQPIPTPNIHRIAKAGITFTNGYVSCPVCSPTRAGLLTGRYQQRFGHEFNTGPARAAQPDVGLPLDQVTLADRLKKLGYATGAVGKWHLGYAPKFHPMKRGFDEFFGFLGGAHSYVDSEADAANRIVRDTKPVVEESYLTDAFGREAVAFVERHKEHPFFLYLAFNAVHNPLQAPDKYLARFRDVEDRRRRTYSAMQSAMDDNVGLLLDKLRGEKLEDNTLIFFISDNGGPTRQTTSRNDPLRGHKGQVWEGGTRVPFMVQWKAKLPEGRVYDAPVISLDIVPTAVAAAGGALSSDSGIDGVDLLPYLKGRSGAPPHEVLFWRFGPQWAIRRGDFKLLKPAGGPVQLFKLAEDIGEQRDLAAELPEVRKQLDAAYAEWNSQLAEPRWQARRARRAGRAKGKARRRAKSPARDN